MISKATASALWCAYDEIDKAESLIKEMEGRMKEGKDPNPRDPFGRRGNLQLGVPSCESSHRLYDVAPKLAMSVIRAHIASKKAELAIVNEQARLELGAEADESAALAKQEEQP